MNPCLNMRAAAPYIIRKNGPRSLTAGKVFCDFFLHPGNKSRILRDRKSGSGSVDRALREPAAARALSERRGLSVDWTAGEATGPAARPDGTPRTDAHKNDSPGSAASSFGRFVSGRLLALSPASETESRESHSE